MTTKSAIHKIFKGIYTQRKNHILNSGPRNGNRELKWHIKDPTLQTTKALKLTEEKEKNVKALESNQQNFKN